MAVSVYRADGYSTLPEEVYRQVIRQAAANPDCCFFYLVPEQTTLQVRRELLDSHPAHVLGNIEVVSFTTLAKRVLEELEIPETNLLDEVGKSMILRRLAEEMKPQLSSFGRNLDRRGFTDELKEVINELSRCAVRTDQLEQVLASLETGGALKQKLTDVYQLYLAFSKRLGETYLTSEELLAVLAAHGSGSRLLKRSRIFLYGFTSFKEYQYRVLEMLMQNCVELSAILTIGEDGGNGLFLMAEGTAARLKRMAALDGIAYEEYTGDSIGRRKAADQLLYLEQFLFRYPAAGLRGDDGAAELVTAGNPGEETEFLVRRLLELVRSEKLRYSEIAVITGDLSVYGSLIGAAFDKAGIPYFMDEKRLLSGNPLAQLLEELLDVLEENMNYQSVMALLRNPLFPAEQESLDLLDNYLVASGVEGQKRWNEFWPWMYGGCTAARLNRINETRLQICGLLGPLWEIWRGARPVSVKTAVETLVAFLQSVHAQEKLETERARFEAEGDFIRESEYRQAYAKVMDLFDQIVQLMGDEEMKPQLLIDTLQSGFEGLKVGVIPVTFDRVVVGDLVRTRIPQVKALFLIGANDRVLPKEAAEGGILTDYDRELLKDAGMELLPTAREEAFYQQEYLYLMMTKPSKHLIVSWSMQNRDGREIRPSYLIRELERLLPDVPVQTAKELYGGLNGLTGAGDGLDMLIEGLRGFLDGKEETWWQPLYRYYCGQEGYGTPLQQIRDGLFYSWRTEALDREIAERLFEAEKANHVTRLEQYANCAYAHFLTYGLKLRPRKEHQLQAADYGTIFHRAISGFFQKLKEQKLDWRAMTAAVRTELAGECVREALQEYANPVFESSARSRYAQTRLTRMTDRTLWALGEQWKCGSFDRILDEYVFSDARGNTVQLPLADGLTLALQGRIDRIDLQETEDAVYVKVIDYKTGQQSFDLGRVYHGLQLQLILYLEAAMEMEQRMRPQKTIVPAGIYYYHLSDPLVDGMGKTEKEQDDLRLKSLRLDGLTNEDPAVYSRIDPSGGRVIRGMESRKAGGLKAGAPAGTAKQFAMLRNYAKKKAAKLAEAMYRGEIDAQPGEYAGTDACEWCEYQAICAFDLRTEGCRRRRLERLSKDDIWNRIDEEEQNGGSVDKGTKTGD